MLSQTEHGSSDSAGPPVRRGVAVPIDALGVGREDVVEAARRFEEEFVADRVLFVSQDRRNTACTSAVQQTIEVVSRLEAIEQVRP